eukprot:CAMPEP_0197870484 /NCGR_PEP_ID=MMETSP1439-20131203/1168_1 /TAXON_ID=66791 /ORGANISM="Gonyaulax spinifera, Strain CCMP409" /LENGTH=309 /DNA_ID=CAMNT_0043489379 /DNA_START=49 /DNA_END=974 /DNA_ORIENTATION=+
MAENTPSQFKTGLMVGAGISACCFLASGQGNAFSAPTSGNLRASSAIDGEAVQRLSAAPVEQAQLADHASTRQTAAPLLALGAVATASALGLNSNRKKKNKKAAASVLPSVVPVRQSQASSLVARRALDQSSRYADLSLTEEDLLKNGKHVLVAYIMKPKAGYDYLATAAHFAAESSTGTNVNVCTTDDFTKTVDALVYFIDPEDEVMKIAYPVALFDRNITDGRAMMCSVLTLSIGNNQGMGDVDYGKIYDIYFPPNYLRLFDGPSCSILDMWRILGRDMTNGGLVVGTIIKPKLGLQPKPFGEACYA